MTDFNTSARPGGYRSGPRWTCGAQSHAGIAREAEPLRQVVVQTDQESEAAGRLDPRQLEAQGEARLAQRGEAIDRGQRPPRLVPLARRAGAHVVVERDLEETWCDVVAQVEPHHPRIVGEKRRELLAEAQAAVEESACRGGARVVDAEAHQGAV